MSEARQEVKENQSSASRRAIANRQNALRSTGPRTEEGKQASRRNAVKHGLAGMGVVLPADIDDDARERRAAWKEAVKSDDQLAVELIDLGATSMSQLRQCWRQTSSARAQMIDRAEQMWEHDRRCEIADLTKELSKDPETIAARLVTTAEGTVWMIERWHALGRRLESGRGWTEKFRDLALDLLGVPELFRDDLSPVDLPDATDSAALTAHRLALVNQELERLTDHLEQRLLPLEEDRRELVRSNLLLTDDPEILLLMRYERQLANRVLRTVRQLRGDKAMAEEARAKEAKERRSSYGSSSPKTNEFFERDDVFAKSERGRERATWDKKPEELAAEARAERLESMMEFGPFIPGRELFRAELARREATSGASNVENQTKPTPTPVEPVREPFDPSKSASIGADLSHPTSQPKAQPRRSAG